MFEFNVGEKEIHKVKVKSGFSEIKVYIDDKHFQSFPFSQSFYPFALEVGESEKHFVFIQIQAPLFSFRNSSLNFQVFIDNKYQGSYKFK